MDLLQLAELLEDGAQGERVPVVRGGGDHEDLHAEVHGGCGDGVEHAASAARDLTFALLVQAAGALRGAEGGGWVEEEQDET